MKYVCIFSHYDIDNIIDEYVIYYLKSLSKIGIDIIFVSDGFLNQKQKNKINNICLEIIAQPHYSLDFGSYRLGYLFIRNKLNSYDGLILCNDSCFGPFWNLKDVFIAMQIKNCDYWGITSNKYGINIDGTDDLSTDAYHIQSYFIVLKKNIFQLDFFNDFMNSIKKEKSKYIVVYKYEIGLTRLLSKSGFKGDSYINLKQDSKDPTVDNWRELIIDYKMPFLKKKVVLGKRFDEKIDLSNIIFEYPLELINSYYLRIRSRYFPFLLYRMKQRILNIFFKM